MKIVMQQRNELFLKLYAMGKTNEQIMDTMKVSYATVCNFKKRYNIQRTKWDIQNCGVSYKKALPEDRWDDMEKFLCSVHQMKQNIRSSGFSKALNSKDAILNLINEYCFYLSGIKRNEKVG